MLLRSANLMPMSSSRPEAKQKDSKNPKDPKDLPERRPVVRLLQGLNRFVCRAYHRLDVLTPCRLPRRGAGIIICNHTSGLDPQLIQACCPRMIIWMMAREYYDRPILRDMLRLVGVIPVTRGGRDMTATRAALRALHEGQLLGIFPEGRIETTRQLLPFQTGVAMMAIKTGVPVFPAYLDGSQRGSGMLEGFLRPQRAVIAFGDEVIFDRCGEDREDLAAATAAMQSAIESLRQFARKARPSRGF